MTCNCDTTSEIYTIETVLGTAVTFMARLMSGSTAVLQADVSTIKLYVYDTLGSLPTTSITAPLSLTVSTSIYDTLQTDDPDWIDSLGYNFKYTLADDVLVTSTTYRVEIVADLVTPGEVVQLYNVITGDRITPQGQGPLLALNDQSLLQLD